MSQTALIAAWALFLAQALICWFSSAVGAVERLDNLVECAVMMLCMTCVISIHSEYEIMMNTLIKLVKNTQQQQQRKDDGGQFIDSAAEDDDDDDDDSSSQWSSDDDSFSDNEQDNGSSNAQCHCVSAMTSSFATAAEPRVHIHQSSPNTVVVTASTAEWKSTQSPTQVIKARWKRPVRVIAALMRDTGTSIMVLLGSGSNRQTTTYDDVYVQELCVRTGTVLQELRLSSRIAATGVLAMAQAGDVFAIQCNNNLCTLFSCCTGKKIRTLDLEAFVPFKSGVTFKRHGTRLVFVATHDDTPCMFTLYGELVPYAEYDIGASAQTDGTDAFCAYGPSSNPDLSLDASMNSTTATAAEDPNTSFSTVSANALLWHA